MDCIKQLKDELQLVQDILYGHPVMEGGTPRAFVDADDEAKIKQQNIRFSTVENDGFEIVSVTSTSVINKLKNI